MGDSFMDRLGRLDYHSDLQDVLFKDYTGQIRVQADLVPGVTAWARFGGQQSAMGSQYLMGDWAKLKTTLTVDPEINYSLETKLPFSAASSSSSSSVWRAKWSSECFTKKSEHNVFKMQLEQTKTLSAGTQEKGVSLELANDAGFPTGSLSRPLPTSLSKVKLPVGRASLRYPPRLELCVPSLETPLLTRSSAMKSLLGDGTKESASFALGGGYEGFDTFWRHFELGWWGSRGGGGAPSSPGPHAGVTDWGLWVRKESQERVPHLWAGLSHTFATPWSRGNKDPVGNDEEPIAARSRFRVKAMGVVPYGEGCLSLNYFTAGNKCVGVSVWSKVLGEDKYYARLNFSLLIGGDR